MAHSSGPPSNQPNSQPSNPNNPPTNPSNPHAKTHQISGHQVYEDLHASDDFQELRKRYRAFAIPWTVAFLVWYLLYVVMSNWATGFMSTKLFGNINVALVFGLLQFVSTFGIAWLYARKANKSLDPLARRLDALYKEELGR